MGAARVDLDAVQIVAENEPWKGLTQLVEIGVVLPQGLAGEPRAWRGFVSPGLLVDREQEVESVEEEVPRATGGISIPPAK